MPNTFFYLITHSSMVLYGSKILLVLCKFKFAAKPAGHIEL
jgi:hypothetical protein